MRVAHIGFPKTATKFLQRSVFARLPERFRYVGEQAAAEHLLPLIHEDDTIFDGEALRARIEDACAGESALFSYEPLTGLHYQTGFVNRTLIANRLKALGFDRIIITIRNQFDALESAYKEYVRNGGVVRLADYVAFPPDPPHLLYPAYYDYRAIFALYARTFGRDNVLVLQHERLGHASFAADLGAFLAVDPPTIDPRERVNASLSREKTEILRLINHFTYNSYRPSQLLSKRISTGLALGVLGKLPLLNGAASCLDAPMRAAIEDFYRDSNRGLEREAGIELAEAYP